MIVTGCLVAAWQTGETTDALKIQPLEFVASARTLIRQALLKAADLQIRGCYFHD